MKRVLTVMVAIALLAGCYQIACAETGDDAKALAEKAAVYWNKNGKAQALSAFNDPNGQFVKGDMYIVAHDFSGVMIANGSNPKLVGSNLMELKDPNGKPILKAMLDVAKTKGSGWVEYTWTNPVTKKVQLKATYVKKIEGENAFVGCGYYK